MNAAPTAVLTDAPAQYAGSLATELKDAVTPRAVALVLGAWVVAVAFMVSYVGAFHAPVPHRIPVAVVAPAQLVDELNSLTGEPLKADAAPNAETARERIMNRDADAALILHDGAAPDVLLVASAAGSAVSQSIVQLTQQIERTQGRQVSVTDVQAPNPKDGRGMSSFYLVVGLVIGGYLSTTALAMSGGYRPANLRRTLIRLAALAIQSITLGLAGAVIVGPIYGALTGHFAALWAIGALIAFTAAAVSTALQSLFGQLGVGFTLLFFVVLGNPSAGGVYTAPLLPPFWSAIGQSLPPGAATTLVRNTAYFHGNGTTLAWWVLATWAASAVLLAGGACLRRAAQEQRRVPRWA
ncbi:DUF3533 domain-containing protein [Kitasatospora sp. GAS204B]|uniref:DUF3533 domain-containing protein n=1 Tax=unclassified Kitasatospora TaxID=2633591 RepID=UPI0024743EF5|nr:DUF3533 domain-containing protein [Kitasatospora sp. GAS204B]MDH6119738.1 hypothetical protein [Kitasatospora sp. GAS204B]